MSLHLESVTAAVPDPSAAAAFWAGLLDRTAVAEGRSALVPGGAGQVGLRFVSAARPRAGRPRLHLHLTSSDPQDQRRLVERALELGGRHLDVGQDPADGFVVLADPAGDELCVIAPGEAFLAGTGRLGEVTCDGTRAVGAFWRDALGWPLVWDEGEQTAVQSPLGGTKISWDSWGGPPRDRTRHWFDLVADDPAGEVERLVALGAVVLARTPAAHELADPDGGAFRVRAATTGP